MSVRLAWLDTAWQAVWAIALTLCKTAAASAAAASAPLTTFILFRIHQLSGIGQVLEFNVA